MLYIIATPIGNLKDITLRSLEILKEVDGVICEDSRRTGLLLNHYQIHKPLTVLNDFNENRIFPEIIERLKSGQNLALVSDAGTPLISDPGYKLVRECIAQQILVDSLPGPSSVTAALSLSGLPPDRFLFVGYPPEKRGKRIKWLEDLKKSDNTIITFVSPHKLLRTLEDMKEVYGDIEIVICRELTKVHQEIRREKISQLIDHYQQQLPKGEITAVFKIT